MSPRSRMRAISAWTPAWWRGSVVRMKSSLVISSVCQSVVEAPDDAVGELLRRDPLLRRGALDLLPVLVGAGEEAHVVAAQALVAREDVGHDRRVDVPDVRQVVDVVDRRRDVERLRHSSLQGPATVKYNIDSHVAAGRRPAVARTCRRDRQEAGRPAGGRYVERYCLSCSAISARRRAQRPNTESDG